MNYPNLELYKDLKPCEDDLFDFINKNFLIIDSFWMLRVKDEVDETPSNANQGDVYLINDQLALFDGLEWNFIDLKDGMYFYNLANHEFYYYDDGLKSFHDKYGDVKGPDSSLSNSVAIFDGESGKFITDSGVIIEDSSIYAESIYSENIYSESIYSEFAVSDHLQIESSLFIGINEFNGQGENAEIPEEDGIQLILTNPLLESINKINKTKGNLLTILNRTGRNIIIKNGNGIFTGTEDDIDLNNEASLLLQRLESDWYIVGGTGGEGSSAGGTGIGLFYADSRNIKPEYWSVGDGSTLEVAEDGLVFSDSSLKWTYVPSASVPSISSPPIYLGSAFLNGGIKSPLSLNFIMRIPAILDPALRPLEASIIYFNADDVAIRSDSRTVRYAATDGELFTLQFDINNYSGTKYIKINFKFNGPLTAFEVLLDCVGLSIVPKTIRRTFYLSVAGNYNVSPIDDIIIIKPTTLEAGVFNLIPPSDTGTQFTVKYIPDGNQTSSVLIDNCEPENNELFTNESRTYFYDIESNIWRAL